MRGAPPLLLLRTIARNPRVLQRFLAGGLLDRGSISLRQRELMILRTCALCGAEYEWGVHVATFGAKAGWTPEQCIRAHEAAPTTPAGRTTNALIRARRQLHATSSVGDARLARRPSHFAPEQLIDS